MAKKGNILTQLALISDLFEKANIEVEDVDVLFTLNDEEFRRMYNLIASKANTGLVRTGDSFEVKIGSVKYLFMINKNSA